MKKVVIIAGPNGAGKTTFAMEFLPNEAGLLELYRHRVDDWQWFDNSGSMPRLLAERFRHEQER